MSPINVYSEIGLLKKIVIHRPGDEINRLIPDYLPDLLFDDIPYLEHAQQEHDEFATVLKKKGIETIYFLDLLTKTLEQPSVKIPFLKEFIEVLNIEEEYYRNALEDVLKSSSPSNLAQKLIQGMLYQELDISKYPDNLLQYSQHQTPYLFTPLVNLLFMRDPFASVGKGINIHNMHYPARQLEALIMRWIFSHHPDFANKNIPFWYNDKLSGSIEGGDVLVLNKNTLAIGLSQRTNAIAIHNLANNLFDPKYNESFQEILVFELPKKRACMHLDTVFTQVDHDKFTVYPDIQELKVFLLSKDLNSSSRYKLKLNQTMQLEQILKQTLGLNKIHLLQCGQNHMFAKHIEQWSDGSNTLTIAPGEVVVYNRNTVTNQYLREQGLIVHEISSGELSRGRGGPRCMSQPLMRHDI